MPESTIHVCARFIAKFRRIHLYHTIHLRSEPAISAALVHWRILVELLGIPEKKKAYKSPGRLLSVIGRRLIF